MTLILASASIPPTAAAAVTRATRGIGNPEEAPPSALGIVVSIALLFVVIATVVIGMRVVRRHRGSSTVSHRRRYGAVTEQLVAEINSAWAKRDEMSLSQLASSELVHQWHSRLGASVPEAKTGAHVDRVRARLVRRELPHPGEDDRVVMHVRARRHDLA